MKILIALMILVFALYFSGCATTPSGSKASSSSGGISGSAPASSASKGVKMLTKKDYDRMGVKEMGAR